MMAYLLRRVTNMGVYTDLDETERKHVNFVNMWSIVMIFATCFAMASAIAFRQRIATLISTVYFGSIFLCLVLNHKRCYTLARISMFFFANAFVFAFSLAVGKEANFHLFYIYNACCPFIMFSKRDSKIMIASELLSVTCFVTVQLLFGLIQPPLRDPVFMQIIRVETIVFLYLLALLFGITFRHSILTSEKAIIAEKERSEILLLNILPKAIANRLKGARRHIADRFNEVTVLFADIVGFTSLSQGLSPEELVEFLNAIYSQFDRIADIHNLEKIKTIGDAYMVAGGVPFQQSNHAEAVAEMALGMQEVVKQYQYSNDTPVQLRIGMDSGPLVAGVIGERKFSYDLWGDTVNTASRMESHGVPGIIQVTERTYERLAKKYVFEKRGEIDVKGKGMMRTYILKDRIDAHTGV